LVLEELPLVLHQLTQILEVHPILELLSLLRVEDMEPKIVILQEQVDLEELLLVHLLGIHSQEQ